MVVDNKFPNEVYVVLTPIYVYVQTAILLRVSATVCVCVCVCVCVRARAHVGAVADEDGQIGGQRTHAPLTHPHDVTTIPSQVFKQLTHFTNWLSGSEPFLISVPSKTVTLRSPLETLSRCLSALTKTG